MVTLEKYEYHIHYSEDDSAYIGSVAEFPYLSADGSTPSEAYAEIKSVVAEVLEVLSKEEKEAPVPFSNREFKGNISLRLSPETHRMASIRARQEGCSLNQFLTSLIERNLYSDTIETSAQKLSSAAALLLSSSITLSSSKLKKSTGITHPATLA